MTKTGKSYESSAPLASGPLLAAVTRSFPTSIVMCSSPTFSRVPCFHRPPGNQPTSQRKCKHGLCTCSRRVCTCLSSTREFRIKLPFSWKQSLSSRNLVIHILPSWQELSTEMSLNFGQPQKSHQQKSVLCISRVEC